jgi:GH25 family lysozyme M1 (1,4-beta-N-acetylmuramidase)
VTLNGYDISAYQSGLNPAALPGDFVIIKATGGDGYVNPSWRQQLAAAKAAGKLVGIYHFARDGYTAATAHSEAQWFIRNCADVLDGTVMAVLDWEADNETDVAYAKAWLDEVTAATGVKPVIYMSFKTIQAANWAPVANADYGLWEAAYVLGYQRIDGYAVPGGRSAIPYWSSICMWQYTSSGYLPGWGSALDLDVFYGDATTWAAYCAKNGVILAATGTETPIQEEDMPLTPDDAKLVAETILNYDLVRQGDGQTGTTNLRALVQWFDNAVSNIVGTVDGHIDAAVKSIPAGQVTLSDAQVQALADKLNASLPAGTLALLKSKL